MISCGERQATAPDPEVEGQQWLSKARTALSDSELADARRQLVDAQKAAAQQGLDIYARDSVDTHLDRMVTKVRFYEKKLEHDRANMQKH